MRKIYTRYIFDIDYTLLCPNWTPGNEYLKQNLNLDKESLKKIYSYITEYEEKVPFLTPDGLVNYFNQKGIPMTKDILDGWLIKNQNMTMVYEGVRKLLVALKSHNKQISVVSDWFKKCQYKRLEKAGLLSYIDTFVFGDTALKPNKEAYEKAILYTPKEQCLFIGDNYQKDIEGPKAFGLDAVQITDENRHYMYRKLRKEIWMN